MAIHEVRINAKDSYEWDSVNRQVYRTPSPSMENHLYFSKAPNQVFGNGAYEFSYTPQISRYVILEFDNPLPRKKFYQHPRDGGESEYKNYMAPWVYTYLESVYESNTADGAELYTQSMLMGMAASEGWIYRYVCGGMDYRTNDRFMVFNPSDPNPRADKFVPCEVGNFVFDGYSQSYGGSTRPDKYTGPTDPNIAYYLRSNPDYLNPPTPPPRYLSPGYYKNFIVGVAPNNYLSHAKDEWIYDTREKQVKFPRLVGSSVSLNLAQSGTNGNKKSNINFHTKLTFSGHQSSNPPYMIAKFEDVIPYTANLSPQFGFVNEKEPIKFHWTMGYEDDSTIEIKPTLAYAEFQWRNMNSATIQTISIHSFPNGNNVDLTLPANTLPNGIIQWRARVETDDRISSEWSDWYELTTIDAIHEPPTPISPRGVTLDGGKQTTFSWITHSSIGTPQHAYEVEISYDLGLSWQAVSGKVMSSNWSFTASPDSFRSGKIGWRVRTYNSDDVPSPWSDVYYYTNKNAPKTPVWIRVEQGKARPKYSWSSVEQVAFQFVVEQNGQTIYEEKTFGVALEGKMPIYLAQGSYVFKLRIQNGTKLWSEWASMNVSIFFTERIVVALQGESQENINGLQWETEVKIL